MKYFPQIIVIIALIVSGLALTLGNYLFSVGVCIVLVYYFNNPLFDSLANLYAKSDIFWVLANQSLSIFLYYLFLRWAGKEKSLINRKMKIILIGVVYLLSVVLNSI